VELKLANEHPVLDALRPQQTIITREMKMQEILRVPVAVSLN
jgi:hypothetical protein